MGGDIWANQSIKCWKVSLIYLRATIPENVMLRNVQNKIEIGFIVANLRPINI